MKLMDVFQSLATGEFAQLKLGDSGTIIEANWPKVIPHVNLGLLNLYSRFALKRGAVTVALQPNQPRYLLNSRYAVSNVRSPAPVKYLLDAGAPFLDDLLKVEQVCTDTGTALALNEASNVYAVSTPSLTTLEVPLAIVNQVAGLPDWARTTQLVLGYRASHPAISVEADAERTDLELPMSHLEALLYYVASRVFPNPTNVNEVNTGAGYFARYEAECRRLEGQSLAIDQGRGEDRLHANGWA